jgi:hypothetical protein
LDFLNVPSLARRVFVALRFDAPAAGLRVVVVGFLVLAIGVLLGELEHPQRARAIWFP